jgi:hypothetical protein
MKRRNLLPILNIPEIGLMLMYYAGIQMKILHYPVANLFLTMVLLTLPMVYLLLGTFTFSSVEPGSLKSGTKYDHLLKARLLMGFLSGATLCVYTITIWGTMMRLPFVFISSIIIWILAGMLTLGTIVTAFKNPRIFWVYTRFLVSVLLLLLPSLILWLIG